MSSACIVNSLLGHIRKGFVVCIYIPVIKLKLSRHLWLAPVFSVSSIVKQAFRSASVVHAGACQSGPLMLTIF